MADGSKVPDFLPDDLWRPPTGVLLTHEEWRAFGALCPLVVNQLLRKTEPVKIGDLIGEVAFCSKTFASMHFTEPTRCFALIAVIFSCLEKSGLLEITPSLLNRPPNATWLVAEALVTPGPRLRTEEGLAAYRATMLPFFALAIGEFTPLLTRQFFGPPSTV